jgi:hypothetical protein
MVLFVPTLCFIFSASFDGYQICSIALPNPKISKTIHMNCSGVSHSAAILLWQCLISCTKCRPAWSDLEVGLCKGGSGYRNWVAMVNRYPSTATSMTRLFRMHNPLYMCMLQGDGAFPQFSVALLLVYGSAASLSSPHQTVVPPLEIYISGELLPCLGAWWYWLLYNRRYTISAYVHFLKPSARRIPPPPRHARAGIPR